jgi:hypothetical protein
VVALQLFSWDEGDRTDSRLNSTGLMSSRHVFFKRFSLDGLFWNLIVCL